jgi:hypothetical protein
VRPEHRCDEEATTCGCRADENEAHVGDRGWRLALPIGVRKENKRRDNSNGHERASPEPDDQLRPGDENES